MFFYFSLERVRERERLYPALSHHHFIFLSIRVRPESFSSFQNKMKFPVFSRFKFAAMALAQHKTGTCLTGNEGSVCGNVRYHTGGVYMYSHSIRHATMLPTFFLSPPFLLISFTKTSRLFCFSLLPWWCGSQDGVRSRDVWRRRLFFFWLYFLFYLFIFFPFDGGRRAAASPEQTNATGKKVGERLVVV